MPEDTPQHLRMMRWANDVRRYRREVLHAVARGETLVADALYDTDPRMARMPLVNLIAAIHRVSDGAARAILKGYYLQEQITLERLSPVTRRRLADELRELQGRREAKRGSLAGKRVKA